MRSVETAAAAEDDLGGCDGSALPSVPMSAKADCVPL
jgi:hypothetical protein